MFQKMKKIFQKDYMTLNHLKILKQMWYANRQSWLSPFKNESTK